MNLATSALVSALAVLLAVDDVAADFVDAEVGARGLAMGGAFVAVSGDPASLYWNPAAIVSERRVQVSGMRTRLFDGVDGLTEDFLGVTGQVLEDLALGVGWTRTGLEDIFHEDVVTGAAAYRVPNVPVVVGVSLLFYGADAPGYAELNDPNYLGSQWETSFSLGALYEWSKNLQFGVSLENLIKPEMALLANSGDVDQIGGRRRLGLSYFLQDTIRFTAEARHHDFPEHIDKSWTLHGGAESWFSDVLALRVGVSDGDLTFGAGLLVKKIRTDLGMITNERLGNTFRAAITLGY